MQVTGVKLGLSR